MDVTNSKQKLKSNPDQKTFGTSATMGQGHFFSIHYNLDYFIGLFRQRVLL